MGAGLAFAESQQLYDWKIDSGVTLRETWTDNVTISASDAKSDFITEISPFISARKRSASMKVDFRYNMQNLFYLSDSKRNATNHQLASSANVELYDKHLFLDARASASQYATTLLGATSTSTLNDTNNVTNIYSLAISPYWQHRFGTYANLLARYSRSQVTSSGSGYSDSGTDSVSLNVFSGSAFTKMPWGLSYSESAVDYANRPDVSFKTLSATLGYAITNRLRVNVTQGYEDNNYQATGGQESSGGFWDVRLAWNPSQRTQFEIGYGDHYYGDSWFGKFTRRGESWSWDVNYAESVTTTSSQFDVNSKGNVNVSGFTFTNADINTQGISNAVYLNKEFRAGLTYNKGRATSGLNLSRVQRTSQESINGTLNASFYGLDLGNTALVPNTRVTTITTTNMNFTLGWRHSTQLSSSLRLGVSRTEFPELGRTDDARNIELGLSRNFARSMTGNLAVRHQERDSSQAGADTTENAVSASVTIPF